jgi:hypothetical protein
MSGWGEEALGGAAWGGGSVGVPVTSTGVFINLSFELGASGAATGWALVGAVAAFQTAVYGGAVSRDGFESAWATNEDYLFAFESIDLTSAEYESPTSIPQTFDGFERYWGSNQSYLYALGGPITATYNSGATNFDAFETGWDSNGSYLYVLGSTTVATYGSPPEDFESFAADWTDPYVTTFSGTAAMYDASPEAFEDFEEDWDTVLV